MGDSTLKADIDAMNQVLQSQSNDSLLNMHQANDKKVATLLRLYADLILVLHMSKNHLIASVALKMIEITMRNGLTPTAPLTFAYYGGKFYVKSRRLGYYFVWPFITFILWTLPVTCTKVPIISLSLSNYGIFQTC